MNKVYSNADEALLDLPDGASVMTASADNTPKVWNSSTGDCLLIRRPYRFCEVRSLLL